MSQYLNAALGAAEVASEITVHYYRSGTEVELKADSTPVTVADREAEQAIVRFLSDRYPDHAFLGEESGRSERTSDYLWIIDPIDGTKNFTEGIPLWGTLIALFHKGQPVCGVSSMPILGEMLHGERGAGVFLNDKQVHVSVKASLQESMISYGSPSAFHSRGKLEELNRLILACRRTRSFGDIWPYHLLASGRLDAVLEASIKIVDIAPFACIIPEAGGRLTDITGLPVTLTTDTVLATNGHLHQPILDTLTRR